MRYTKRLLPITAYNGDAFAFMVLHKGIPVAEAYKPQFNQKNKISELVNGQKFYKCTWSEYWLSREKWILINHLVSMNGKEDERS